MLLFLHIKLTKVPLIFSYNAMPAVKHWAPEVTVFDVDNHADALTIQTAIKAMHKAEKIFLHIDAEEEADLGGMSKILNQVIRLTSPIAIFYQRDHKMLNQIMTRFKNKLIDSNIGLKDAVLHFFNQSS